MNAPLFQLWVQENIRAPNFVWDLSHKYSTASPKNIEEIWALFVSTKIGFTVEHLKHHSFLQFRACVSATRTSTLSTLFMESSQNWFAKMHTVAIMSWVAVQELYPLQLHLSIKIGDEITPQALHAYNQHLQFKIFPPKRRRIVKKLVTCR